MRAGSGADVFVERLAAGLERAGHEPIVQWFRHRCELMPRRLKPVSAPTRIDVVHANTWQGFAFKRPGVPLVVTEHHFILHPLFAPHRNLPQRVYHGLAVRRWLRRTYRVADALVAISHHTAEAMRTWCGREVSVIHNWVDVERYREAMPGESCQVRHASGFRLLFVGNPSRWKGADLLPALARRLGPDFEIRCMAGLRRDIQRSGPANLISLPRVAPTAMPKVYAEADAVLVLARYEAFGYVALEAMACGRPVIGFDNTGTREICIDEETALLCPTGDLDAMAAAATRLKRDPRLAEALGRRALARARTQFNEDAAIGAYVDLYRRLR